MRSKYIKYVSVLLVSAAVCLAFNGVHASRPIVAPHASICQGSWPPPARDLFSFGVSGIAVPHNGQPVAIYTVPSDKYLVVTRMRFTSGEGPSSFNSNIPIHIYGSHGIQFAGQHQFLDPLNQSDHQLMGQADGLGLSFEPGTVISLLGDHSGPIMNVSVTLIGYFRDE